MAMVKELLGRTRLLTLTGAGGSGKTRLALQVCRELERERRYRDGVRWVELAALSEPALVPQAIATVLGVAEQPGRSLTDTLLDVLQEKRMLLGLDNCEHLIEACAGFAGRVLRECPEVRLLLTSRERLNVEGERAWVVPPLSLPAQAAVDGSESDAMRLFVERAAAIEPDFHPDAQNAKSIALICERVDGIPLAIELAAARVRVLSPAQIAERLDDAMRLLTGGRRSALERHQTLRATMDWSRNLLSTAEQVLFRRLAVFRGGFTLAAAEAIGAGGAVASDAMLELLTHLVDKSLVVKLEQDEEARFRLLEPIRQYAHEKLLDAGEEETAGARHLQFFLELVEVAQPKLTGGEQMGWLDRMDEEHDNLRAAIGWARTHGEVEFGLRIVNALQWFWLWRGYWREARGSLADLLTHPGTATGVGILTPRRARAVVLEASFATELDGSVVAETLIDQAVTLAYAVEDEQAIAEAIFLRGYAAIWRFDHPVARADLDESLARARAIGDAHLTARVLTQRSKWLWFRGEVKAARADVEEALGLYEGLGNQIGKTECLSTLGAIAHNEGDYATARQLNQESLALARELGLRWEMGLALQRLAQALVAEGEYATAQPLFDENLALRRDLGDRVNVAHILNLMSNMKRLTGDLSGARSLAEEALKMAKQFGVPLSEAHALAALGKVALAEGNFLAARALLEECLSLRQGMSNRLDMPMALLDLGDLAFCENEAALARGYYEEAREVSRELANQAMLSNALRMLGYIALSEGDLGSASRQFAEGLRLNQQKKFRLGMIRHLPALAALVLAQGDAQRAARVLAAADGLLEAMGVRLDPADRTAYANTRAGLAARLDGASLEVTTREGRAMTLEQAIEHAGVETRPEGGATGGARRVGAKQSPGGLTPREREIAVLIAQGKSNRGIAEQLVLSERTVENHIGNILSKLHFHSRTQIATWAVDHGLGKYQG